jgi:dienelactone hydrolase
MRAMISLLAVVVCLSVSKGGSAALVTTNVSYVENGITLHGYAAYDDASANAKPIVVIVPQWSSLGNYEKKRAFMLADLGYFAFAADIYGVAALNSTSTMADWGVQTGIYREYVSLFVRLIAAAVTEAKLQADRQKQGGGHRILLWWSWYFKQRLLISSTGTPYGRFDVL